MCLQSRARCASRGVVRQSSLGCRLTLTSYTNRYFGNNRHTWTAGASKFIRYQCVWSDNCEGARRVATMDPFNGLAGAPAAPASQQQFLQTIQAVISQQNSLMMMQRQNQAVMFGQQLAALAGHSGGLGMAPGLAGMSMQQLQVLPSQGQLAAQGVGHNQGMPQLQTFGGHQSVVLVEDVTEELVRVEEAASLLRGEQQEEEPARPQQAPGGMPLQQRDAGACAKCGAAAAGLQDTLAKRVGGAGGLCVCVCVCARGVGLPSASQAS